MVPYDPASTIRPVASEDDRESAKTGLCYYGYRYYDSITGRWPSRDPIGERGGINVFTYSANRPIGSHDVLGLFVAPRPGGDGFGPPKSCAEKRKEQRDLIDRMSQSGGESTPNCSGEPGCTLITFIVMLPDPCDGGKNSKLGHAGVGIGEEFYDIGPDFGNNSPTTPWWDDPSPEGALGSYWEDQPDAPSSSSDIDLDDIVDAIGDGNIADDKQVVKVEYCACKESTAKMQKYWDELYKRLEKRETAPEYSVPGLQCASAVYQGLTGGELSGWLSPTELLFGKLRHLKNECGPNKGEKAHFKGISP